MKLYDYPPSGNGYKARLALAYLGIPYEYMPVDILAGQSRTPEFLAMNANGRIPLLKLPDGTCIAESNAILYFLAQGTPLWPRSTIDQTKALQWMFFEQYSHEPNIATVRFWVSIKRVDPSGPEAQQIQAKTQAGYDALGVMEAHLSRNPYFVGTHLSIADIALYAYTHVAGEGGFDLEPFPAIRDWLTRVSRTSGHVAINASTPRSA
jgi:glutathione S-transferase